MKERCDLSNSSNPIIARALIKALVMIGHDASLKLMRASTFLNLR